jgi:DNA primase
LEDSANRVEYQLNAIAKKYDLRSDEDRVKYVQESAGLIATLPSPVQREIYGTRVAEHAGIGTDAMKLEISNAWKRKQNQEKKKQEKIDLSPARQLQPKSKTIRYDNMRSAMAEESVIAMAFRDPSLLDRIGALKPESFSVPLLGRVFRQLVQRHEQALEISPAVLEDVTGEEMSHIAAIVQRHQGPVNENEFSDCVKTILSQYQSANVSSGDDLLAFQKKLRESKGVKA